MNDLPIHVVNGSLVRIRDVAHVRDGYAVQTNIVHRDGVRGALITVLKSGGASTIDVVNRVRAALPGILATLPPALQVDVLADQSLFVKAALNGVLVEALIAAILTASMILLFLGSWRSTLIVVLSIPLSILCSVTALGALGQTINVMTLGGLALAVGVLVDDATVGIENIHRVLEHDGTGDIEHAILKGAGQIAIPTLVSTLAICIVFVPIFFLSGAAGSLFAPLAMAVVFAMMASYVISRTLVPTLVRYALEREGRIASMAATETHVRHGPFARFHLRFEAWFERARLRYRDALGRILKGPGRLLTGFVALVVVSAALVPWLGQDFFPAVDAGQIRLHLRAPIGTRVEETARLVAAVEGTVRRVIPPHELATILDNVGLSSSSSTNLAFSDNPTTGVTDADVLIVLSPERTGTRGRVSPRAASHAARRVSAGHDLLPGRRYRGTDPQLRIAGADQCAGGRTQSGEEHRDRAVPRATAASGPGGRRCVPAATSGRTDAVRRCRSCTRRRDVADGTRSRQRPAGLAGVDGDGGAQRRGSIRRMACSTS